MKLDRDPVYRRVIYRWYDSEWSCIVAILLMSFVLFFSISGIFVALEKFDYRQYVWVPALLSILSGAIIISNTVRLVMHVYHRLSKKVSRIDIGDT